MRDARLKWKTVDETAVANEIEEPFTKMRFQQQRIRTFTVEYIVVPKFV
jgi:hypothetical protein